MGNQGFLGEARAPAQSSIVQERNKAAISNLNATTQMNGKENVHYRQTYGEIQNPSVGLPILHVLIVTHLRSCVEIGDSSFVPSCTMDD